MSVCSIDGWMRPTLDLAAPAAWSWRRSAVHPKPSDPTSSRPATAMTGAARRQPRPIDRRQRRVHARDQERHAVDAGQLGDLDDRQDARAGNSRGAPRGSRPSGARAATPPPPRAAARAPSAAAAPMRSAQPGHRRRGQRHVEAAVRGERGDRQPRDRPRDRAEVQERVVEPAQEHDEEHGAGEPPVRERGARRPRQATAQRRDEPDPGEEPPVGARGRPARRARPRPRRRQTRRRRALEEREPLRPHGRADRRARAASPRAGSSARPPCTSYATRRMVTRRSSRSHSP